MNERIKELYDQASIRYSVYEILKPRDERKSIPDIFAELIVRECLNQCYNRGMDDELYAGQLKAATYIEEYFGVENES